MKSGFIYLWFDTKRSLFYLGAHLGTLEDGYVGSNKRLRCAYTSRPQTFKRRILEFYENTDWNFLKEREGLWLNLIKDEELHCVKYYNEKKVPAGGDIVSTLPESKRELHRQRSIEARKRARKKWVKENPEEVKRLTSIAGRASAEKNKGKNLKQKEVLERRKGVDAFMTPLGPRPFITKAADELGISYVYLRKLLDTEATGYYWINKGNHFYK